MELYLLKYNNYYNRQAKREQTLDDYMPYLLPVTQYPMITQPVIQKYNFKPNDGVRTYADVNWYGDIPDYVLVVDHREILSRWFVLEATRLRDGQYRLQLYRDTIADYWDDLRYSTAFIEKGMIDDVTNPLLYNAENMSFNQLRNRVHWLYDKTNCPWIVGYIPQDASFDTELNRITIEQQFPPTNEVNFTVDNIANWNYYQFWDEGGKKLLVQEDDKLIVHLPVTIAYLGLTPVPYLNPFTVKLHGTSDYSYVDEGPADISLGLFTPSVNTFDLDSYAKWLADYIQNYGAQTYANAYQTFLNNSSIVTDTATEIFEIRQLEGKIIYDSGADKYYQIGVKFNNISLSNYPTTWSTFVNTIGACMPPSAGYSINNVPTIFTNTFGENPNIIGEFSSQAISLTLKPVGVRKLEVEIPSKENRVHCIDQPFDIFCIPYSDSVEIWNETKTNTYQSQKNVNLVAAQSIGLKLGEGSIYDVQILPYCPILNIADDRGYLNSKLPSSYIGIRDGDNLSYVGKIWWVRNSEISFNIDIPASFAIGETNPKSAKIKSQTQFGRLCSPNYSQYYDFNIQKNRGCDSFLVQGIFRPYNPWFKITPVWKSGGLYYTGNIEHDARGLVLSGDFSVAQATSAWANYELNNKNYLNIFNRQMQNTEFNMAWDRAEAIVGANVGIAQGTISGAANGGGIPGAIVGAVTSTIGGGLDIGRTISTQYEALDYTRDMFEYNLGNIKALPQGLARTGAQNPINTFVPTFEVWETTSTEEELLYNKITYNGMTVDAIGMLGNWITEDESYLKCQLIRCPSISDFHLINTISGELYKGVFLSELSILN